jgi:hypothetical protein
MSGPDRAGRRGLTRRGQWIPGVGELVDVDGTFSDGDVLIYDAASGTWIPTTASSLSGLPRDTYEDETYTIDQYRQLVITGQLNLLGSASIVNNGVIAIL